MEKNCSARGGENVTMTKRRNRTLFVVDGVGYCWRLIAGDPDDFVEYLAIDSQTGDISVIQPVADSDAAAFFVIVEVRQCYVISSY